MAPCSLALVLGGKRRNCPYDLCSLVGTHGAKQGARAKNTVNKGAINKGASKSKDKQGKSVSAYGLVRNWNYLCTTLAAS